MKFKRGHSTVKLTGNAAKRVNQAKKLFKCFKEA